MLDISAYDVVNVIGEGCIRHMMRKLHLFLGNVLIISEIAVFLSCDAMDIPYTKFATI